MMDGGVEPIVRVFTVTINHVCLPLFYVDFVFNSLCCGLYYILLMFFWYFSKAICQLSAISIAGTF